MVDRLHGMAAHTPDKVDLPAVDFSHLGQITA